MQVLLNVKQVAAALGISVRTLERMRSNGIGPKFIRASSGAQRGRIAYAEQDITEWLDIRRRASTSDPGCSGAEIRSEQGGTNAPRNPRKANENSR